jgi:CheY-like chemotaxis protein
VESCLAHILIVEDEGIVSADIQDRLRSLGYRTTIVADGKSALETAALLKPSLVLMDIILKGEIDGIEAAQAIYRQFRIPVVFLTAHADERTFRRAQEAEPFGYIIKPFNEEELYSTIVVALEKHRKQTALRREPKRRPSP